MREDAVVRLYDVTTDQTVRWFFVQAGNSINMKRIPQGAYRLAYTSGLDWIESQDVFRWHPFYSEFERSDALRSDIPSLHGVRSFRLHHRPQNPVGTKHREVTISNRIG